MAAGRGVPVAYVIVAGGPTEAQGLFTVLVIRHPNGTLIYSLWETTILSRRVERRSYAS